MSAAGPVALLADSRLLLGGATGDGLSARLREALPGHGACAAYIGASNGDEVAHYELFEAAVARLGVTDRGMVHSAFRETDRRLLERADLVLLAGGEVVRGWRAMVATGMLETLIRRHRAGSTLIGVSAGAVQLGRLGSTGSAPRPGELLELARVVPAIVGVHEEETGWERLERLVGLARPPVHGLGIPSGGGLLVHPDGSFEPFARPVIELVGSGTEVRSSLLPPS